MLGNHKRLHVQDHHLLRTQSADSRGAQNATKFGDDLRRGSRSNRGLTAHGRLSRGFMMNCVLNSQGRHLRFLGRGASRLRGDQDSSRRRGLTGSRRFLSLVPQAIAVVHPVKFEAVIACHAGSASAELGDWLLGSLTFPIAFKSKGSCPTCIRMGRRLGVPSPLRFPAAWILPIEVAGGADIGILEPLATKTCPLFSDRTLTSPPIGRRINLTFRVNVRSS
jgi:hypothetical protein